MVELWITHGARKVHYRSITQSNSLSHQLTFVQCRGVEGGEWSMGWWARETCQERERCGVWVPACPHTWKWVKRSAPKYTTSRDIDVRHIRNMRFKWLGKVLRSNPNSLIFHVVTTQRHMDTQTNLLMENSSWWPMRPRCQGPWQKRSSIRNTCNSSKLSFT